MVRTTAPAPEGVAVVRNVLPDRPLGHPAMTLAAYFSQRPDRPTTVVVDARLEPACSRFRPVPG